MYVVTGTLPGYGSSIQIAAAAFRLQQLPSGAAVTFNCGHYKEPGAIMIAEAPCSFSWQPSKLVVSILKKGCF